MPMLTDKEHAAYAAWKKMVSAWHAEFGQYAAQEFPKYVGSGPAARIAANADEEKAMAGRPTEVMLPAIVAGGKDYRNGDEVEFSGGYKLHVSGVSGMGEVTTFRMVDAGHYDEGFAGTLNQTSTSGTGSGMRIAAPKMAAAKDARAKAEEMWMDAVKRANEQAAASGFAKNDPARSVEQADAMNRDRELAGLRHGVQSQEQAATMQEGPGPYQPPPLDNVGQMAAHTDAPAPVHMPATDPAKMP